MKIDREWSVWHQRGFTWWGHWLAQHIWADPCFEDQDHIISHVHARTDLLDGFTGSDEQCVTLMQLITPLTSMSGPIRDPRKVSRIQLAANVKVHAEIKDWLAYIITEAAVVQADLAHKEVEKLAKAVKAQPAYSAHPKSGIRRFRDEILDVPAKLLIPAGQGASRYRGQETLDALEWLQRPPCVLATGDENGFCAEFPFGAFTSLLQVRTDLSHPFLGNGLYMTLQPHEGPSGWENPEAARMALELNEREQRERLSAHFLGSWCPTPLCFLSFFPNNSCAKGGTTNLALSAMRRAYWTAVDVFQAGWDFERAVKLKREMMEDLDRGLESMAEAIEAEEEKRMKSEPNPSIRFPCPHCGQSLKAPAEKSGATSSCPFCRQAVTVPATGTVSAGSPSPASAAAKQELAPDANPAALANLARAKAETRGDCRRPCGPFVEPNLGNLWGEMIPLVRWGILNPYGPTLTSLFLIRLASAKESLIVDVLSNPFAGVMCCVRGWHPAAVDGELLEQTLRNIGKAHIDPLFCISDAAEVDRLKASAGNDSLCATIRLAESWRLLMGGSRYFDPRVCMDHVLVLFPPSVVQLLPQSPLPPAALKRLLKGFLVASDAKGIDERCRLMRHHWCSPWERTRAELYVDELNEVARQLPSDSTNDERIAAVIARHAQLASDKPMDDSDYEEWWALVTSEDHVASDLGVMLPAWERAIEHGPGLQTLGTNPGLTIHGPFEEEAVERLQTLAAFYISRLGRESKYDSEAKISHLDLSTSAVTDANLAEFCKVRFVLPHLRLNLSHTAVSDAGLRYLRGMDCIEWLNLIGTKVTPGGMAKLRKALPNAQIIGP
jgi:hypothetical protein